MVCKLLKEFVAFYDTEYPYWKLIGIIQQPSTQLNSTKLIHYHYHLKSYIVIILPWVFDIFLSIIYHC